MHTRTIPIDIVPGGEPPVINVSQYDKDSRTFEFTLFSSDGEFEIPPGATASISGLKPDGNGFDYAATLEDNTVTVEITEQMTAVAGRVPCKIEIEKNNTKILTEKFILKVDRYTVALNGIQGFDQNFKYHVSALKSPIPFRFGVNLGGNFDAWKWRLGKAKYKSTKIPLFDDEIDDVRLNLVNSIHNIFSRGVEQAMLQNEKAQEAVEEKKAEVSYSAEETEDLSTLEKKAIEAFENSTGEEE